MFKARFVAHGNRDTEKNQLFHDSFHDSSTARQSSIRLLVAPVAIMGFDIWTEDISKAYLKSASKLLREVYFRPNRQLKIFAPYLLKLLRPLYGLANSDDYWIATFAKHLEDNLKMKPMTFYVSLFFKHARGQLSGVLESYVDDTWSCRENSFAELSKRICEAFDVKKREHDNMRFSGLHIGRYTVESHIHQSGYINRLEQLPRDADFTLFRRDRAKLSWLVHTKPAISIVAGKEFNPDVRYLLSTGDLSLNMCKLDIDSLQIRVYSDASFATNCDYISQLGYTVLLMDKT